MPKNPINGYIAIDILASLESEDYHLIGSMIEKTWEILFKLPKISKEALIGRITDFTRSKLK